MPHSVYIASAGQLVHFDHALEGQALGPGKPFWPAARLGITALGPTSLYVNLNVSSAFSDLKAFYYSIEIYKTSLSFPCVLF